MMPKSKSITDMLTRTDTNYRKYVILSTIKNENCRAKLKTVESFEKHSILLLLPFCFTRIL